MGYSLLKNMNETIAAVSTPPGKGGIAVIRISGPQAVDAANRLWRGANFTKVETHTIHYGEIMDGDGVLDQAVASIFRSPNSFTGDDVVELSVHGSPYVQQRLLRLLIDGGDVRLALPGEFTQRAFLAGKLDLAQAEAIADVIAAESRGAHRLAISQMKGRLSGRINMLREELLELLSLLELELDFSEEDVEFASRDRLLELCGDIQTTLRRLADSFSAGRAIVDGLPVVIAGCPNAGKSTLLNELLDDDRAIVSDIPGTTRDTIEDIVDIEGTRFRFVDTAGIRENTSDRIELTGIRRAVERIEKASLILFLFDGSPDNFEESCRAWNNIVNRKPHYRQIVIPVISKADILTQKELAESMEFLKTERPNGEEPSIEISSTITHSSKNPDDLAVLKKVILDTSRELTSEESYDVVLTNARHYEAINRAMEHIENARIALQNSIPADLVAHHLRMGVDEISAVTGNISTPEILSNIFSRFCIGK